MEYINMKTLKFLLCSALLTGLSTQAAVIVSESFGGSNANSLDGTSADTFDAAILTAGGVNQWQTISDVNYIRAGGDFSVPAGNSGSSLLDLGSYINDARGTASGKFILQASFTQTATAASGVGLSFNPTTNTSQRFWESSSAVAIYRGATNTGYDFGTINAGNTFDGGNFTGLTTLKIELDMTSWDGSTNYGLVNFYDPTDLGSIAWTYNFTAADNTNGFTSINSIRIQYYGGNITDASVSDFTLTQIPEPSSLILVGLGLAGAAFLRRRK
jgi:hypothetical protein